MRLLHLEWIYEGSIQKVADLSDTPPPFSLDILDIVISQWKRVKCTSKMLL